MQPNKISRLLCDVNRPVTSETIFRQEGDGKLIELNKGRLIQSKNAIVLL